MPIDSLYDEFNFGERSPYALRQFLLYARGSAQEVLTQLRLARRLRRNTASDIRRMEGQVVLILKMLTRLYDHPPPDR